MQENWQTLLKAAITDPAELLNQSDLSVDLLPAAQRAAKLFPLCVTKSFISRMEKGNSADPLLQQVLPLALEEIKLSDYSQDPLLEKSANPLPGLLHKYHGRILLTLTGACAIHCRYCFRRHFPYQDNRPGKVWQDILAYIAADSSIYEVILSGGDPLMLSDHHLVRYAKALSDISHLKILRIHSRLPIVLPERITTDLVNRLSEIPLQIVMVIHSNHANEIDSSVKIAVNRLWQKKITLLNQSVLLKGVNDTLPSLYNLSLRLFECGILPYYLHVLDKVQGAAHFAIDEQRAKQLLVDLREKLPGYLVPKLVYEQAGAKSKLPLI